MRGRATIHKSKTPIGVSRKIPRLIDEGKSRDQAAAMAYSMSRAGRLTSRGNYIRKGGRSK